MNQILEIKNHLEKRGYITSMQAIELYGATRLSSIIYELRNKYNMNIETERRTSVNRYGNTVSYGFYKLKEDKKMSDKRFYWIKLKTDFFEQDAIDFLLSQTNGSDYIALYIKLCTMTANTNGQLATQIGEILIPYDAQKIARDTKYFSVDTVVVAMELFKKLGLIYESNDNVLQIANYDSMVGSSKMDEHTKRLNAERQRRFKENQKQKLLENNVTVTHGVTLKDNAEYRDKSIEIRDKSIDIDKEKDSVFDKQKQTKHKYGEYHHVLLDDNQYEHLKELYGEDLEGHIKILDEYLETSGKKYKNHSLVIQKWVHDRYERDKHLSPPKLDSKFYAETTNISEDDAKKELERVRREILGNS